MRLLVLNCHEAWVHQLGVLDAELDIAVGLPGRFMRDWDARIRPLPSNARTITLSEARASRTPYDCVINHNIADLLDTREIDAPKLLVLHETLEEHMAQQGAEFNARDMQATLNTYLASVGGHAIAISRMKARSWGVTHVIVHNMADPDAYPEHSGILTCGIRVANHINSKRVFLAWEFHDDALDGLPMKLVGHNPDMPGVSAAQSWDGLKRDLSSHRFYVHTANPHFEDGFNMAMLEAMAAGLPVLVNRHPTTIVEHRKSGFICETPAEMRMYAEHLLADPVLAHEMGAAARRLVGLYFGPGRFKVEFTRALAEAKQKWARRRRPATARR